MFFSLSLRLISCPLNGHYLFAQAESEILGAYYMNVVRMEILKNIWTYSCNIMAYVAAWFCFLNDIPSRFQFIHIFIELTVHPSANFFNDIIFHKPHVFVLKVFFASACSNLEEMAQLRYRYRKWWCWWFYYVENCKVGGKIIMLVTFSGILVPYVQNRSPTSKTCHQCKRSSKSVTNIDIGWNWGPQLNECDR